MAESESAAVPLGDTPTVMLNKSPIGRGTWTRTREMAGSKPAALPLGYTPIQERVVFDNGAHYKELILFVNN